MNWTVSGPEAIGTEVPKTKIATIKVAGKNNNGTYNYVEPEFSLVSPIPGLTIVMEGPTETVTLTKDTVVEHNVYISGTIGELDLDNTPMGNNGQFFTWESGVLSVPVTNIQTDEESWIDDGITIDVTVNNYNNYNFDE
jgi:hypothetical protein